MSNSKNKHNGKMKCFFNRLYSEYGLTHKQFKKQYQYCGGDGRSTDYNGNSIQLKGELKYAIQRGLDMKTIAELHKDKCLCGSNISNNIFFQHKETKKIIVIGNKCCKRYMNKKRHCSYCGEIHKNNKNNICNKCRKENNI